MRVLKRFIWVLLIAAAGAGVWLFLKSPLMRLQSIDIVMDPKSQESFLFDRIRTGLEASLAPYQGLPFWKISLERVMADVRKDQLIRAGDGLPVQRGVQSGQVFSLEGDEAACGWRPGDLL